MSIVCGTDFGEGAIRAAEVAAGIAARLGTKLHLVHALELPVPTFLAGEPVVLDPSLLHPGRKAALEQEADRVLEAEAARLRTLTGAEILPRLAIGGPQGVLLDTAKETRADLVVTGSWGRNAASRLLVGSTTDRLARTAAVPLLIVRGHSDRLLSWSRGERTLSAMIAVDAEGEGMPVAAMKTLLAAGPCEVHYAHVFGLPAAMFYGFDGELAYPLATPSDVAGPVAERVGRLARDAKLPFDADRLHLLEGRVVPSLLDLAGSKGFDVLLAGTQAANTRLQRWLLGSTALGLLHGSPCPIAIEPVRKG